ncbi:PREDICTED: phospholipase A1-IIdelta-like [Fragaria vesca subsp. vesca]|uniref:phospholipase A1-IIdelta-like n=1 Tax=Fragaria vesca subsp. vesca TaxID=101020 RepID=UPI0002C356A7|nr:PREDICTED: phospholipase A1-IIdelta-like [Fragaria vesca subsp. vesca]
MDTHTTTQTQTPDSTTEPVAGLAWSALLGENNWAGLLDPLDVHLRTLILRCGDFCQGTYDAFNNDANSKYAGSSRYGHANFFDKVMLQDAANYEIAFFLYTTAQVSVPEAFLLHSMSHESWDRESNWIGYVVVTTDQYSKSIGHREIYVAWRGNTRNYEWVNVLGAELVSAEQLLRPENNNTVNKTNSSMNELLPTSMSDRHRG